MIISFSPERVYNYIALLKKIIGFFVGVNNNCGWYKVQKRDFDALRVENFNFEESNLDLDICCC